MSTQPLNKGVENTVIVPCPMMNGVCPFPANTVSCLSLLVGTITLALVPPRIHRAAKLELLFSG